MAPEFWSGAVPFTRMINKGDKFYGFFFFFLMGRNGRNPEFLKQ